MPVQPFGKADPMYDALRVFSQQALDQGVGSGIDEGAAAWSKILVMKNTDNTATAFDFSVTGLLAALAFADAGDIVWCGPGTLTTDITLPADISLTAMASRFILIGTITAAGSGTIERISVLPSGNSASRISAVISATSGTLTINNCNLHATNAGAGGAAGVSTQAGGTVDGWNSVFTGTGTNGYGVNASAGTFRDHGMSVYSGTTDRWIGNFSAYNFDNDISLLDSAGALVKVYPADSVGIAAAIAAATSGDVITCPSHIAIARTSGITIGAGVTLKGANLAFSGFAGTGVTMSAGSVMVDFYIAYNGSGQASARGVLANGVACALNNGDCFATSATTNMAYELSGQDSDNVVNTTNIYGGASGGTTSVGMRLGDYVHAKTSYGSGRGAATNNVGVRFFASADTNWLLNGWGYCTDAGSAGMEVEAGKYARIIGGFAVGVLAGLLIGSGATALVYGLQWSSLVNSGTLTHLPGDREGGTNWFNVEDFGAVHNGSTDDTAAIQAAIDAAAVAGGVVYFPRGVYIVNGALQDGSRGNAQLLLPDIDTTGEQVSITLLGETLPGLVPSLTGTITTPHATTLKGTLNSGAGGALLGGWGPVGSYQDFTLINLRIENLAFQMPANPVLSALNLSHVEAIDLVNVVVHTGTYQVSAITQPTTATSYGIVTPNQANGAWTVLDGVLALGFYTGFKVNEHTTATYMNAMGCHFAVEVAAGLHASHIDRLMIQWNTYGLHFTGAHHITIAQLNIEHHDPTSVWYDTVYDVDDASNYGIGSIVYNSLISGTGADDPLLINGGSNLHITSIHDAGATVATDSIWDAKGDIAAATGANAAIKVAVGSNGQILVADSSQTAGVKWASAPEILMADGITPPDPLTLEDETDWLYEG